LEKIKNYHRYLKLIAIQIFKIKNKFQKLFIKNFNQNEVKYI